MILFLVILVIIALLLQVFATRRGMKDLEVSVRLASCEAEPGEETDLAVTFENHTIFFIPYVRYVMILPSGLSSKLGKVIDYGVFAGEIHLQGSVWLKPREKLVKHFPVVAEKRGRYVLWSIIVDTGDFLGLKSTSKKVPIFQEMVVYPRKLNAENVPETLGGFLGDRSVRRFLFEDPILTIGFHEYTGTEPMKMISWTRSAREGQLMVKRPDYTMEPSVSVVLNISGISDSEEDIALLENTFSLARIVLEHLNKQGVQHDFRMNAVTVGSVSSWEYVTEGLGKKHLMTLLEGLGRAICTTKFPARELMARAVMHTGEQRGIIYITPGLDAREDAEAARTAARAGVRLVILRGTEVRSC